MRNCFLLKTSCSRELGSVSKCSLMWGFILVYLFQMWGSWANVTLTFRRIFTIYNETIVACRINMMFKMPKELHLECSIHHKKIISLLPPLFMITVPREEERKGVWRGWSASLPSPNPRWTARQGPRGCGTVFPAMTGARGRWAGRLGSVSMMGTGGHSCMSPS